MEKLKLVTRMGLALEVPESWEDKSDDKIRVFAPDGTQLTGAAYPGAGQSLEAWAERRFAVVAEGMSYLKQVRAPYELQGRNWAGVAAEYQGIDPGANVPVHYLVVALCVPPIGFSFTITAEVEDFKANEPVFRGLIQQRLYAPEVTRATPPPAAPTPPQPTFAQAVLAYAKRRWFALLFGALMIAGVVLMVVR